MTPSARIVSALGEIDARVWDRCAAPETQSGGRPENPFITHRFLNALEESGSVAPRTGWTPAHLLLEDAGGDVLGVAPLYLKAHSRGEYVFDAPWADAFTRAGGAYYPKLQCASPFTPVSGRRLLARADAPNGLDYVEIERMLAQATQRFAEISGVSSLHVTFCAAEEYERLGGEGFLGRVDQQFHWRNDGYEDFDAFLAALSARKRKQIRKERAKALEAGVEVVWLTGDALKPHHWDAFWSFYQDTGARKWGAPYLTRSFFEILQAEMRDLVMLALCRRDGRWIAGALNLLGRDCLYGRYWGCVEDHPYLHFETCYYQAIDVALARGLARVEAGAQGAHKLARGYMPAPTYSLHWIAHPGFRAAVARYLAEERDLVSAEATTLREMGPFRVATPDRPV